MSKKLVMRRVAILLALVVGIIQMQLGGAVTATSYDFATSNQTIRSDTLSGGSASTAGSADVSGTVSATANATSSQPIGSKNFGARAIGGNYAKRDSYVRKTFSGLTAGSHTVTITVDVSSLTTPAQAYTPGLIDDSVIAACYPPEPVPQSPTCPDVPLTNSRSYSFVQLGGSAVSSVPDEDGNYPATATFKSTDGGFFNEVVLGSNTLSFTISLPSTGALVVELHLIAEAWAAGDEASASGGLIADVTSIEVL